MTTCFFAVMTWWFLHLMIWRFDDSDCCMALHPKVWWISNPCLWEQKTTGGVRWLEVMALERFLGGGFLGEAFFGVSVAGCWIWGSIWGRLPQPFQNQSKFQNDLSRRFPRSRPDLRANCFPIIPLSNIAGNLLAQPQLSAAPPNSPWKAGAQGLWGYRCFHVWFNETVYRCL